MSRKVNFMTDLYNEVSIVVLRHMPADDGYIENHLPLLRVKFLMFDKSFGGNLSEHVCRSAGSHASSLFCLNALGGSFSSFSRNVCY